MPLLFARVHARQGAPGGMELYYSYKACTGTQVKYTEKTCPWSLDAGFNAGTVSFDFHADHSFCDIDDEHPFLGYSGLFASELVSPSPNGARLPRASSFLASKASRIETPAHARQSRQAERETRRYACSKHSGCRTSGGMTLHAALNGITQAGALNISKKFVKVSSVSPLQSGSRLGQSSVRVIGTISGQKA